MTKKEIINGAAIILVLVIMVVAIYWTNGIAKEISYSWWYKDMVEQTVREMVKPEYLK